MHGLFLLIMLGGLLSNPPSAANDLALIAQVGPQGQGSAAARQARDRLALRGIEFTPQLLVALDTPNIVAANWYRSIWEDIVARELQRPDPRWPLAEFKTFIQDERHQGRTRRMVLNLIERIEPGFTRVFLPARLGDVEFRNDAVDLALEEGDRLRGGQQLDLARGQYRAAFTHARDSQQVLTAARKLQETGESVDPVRHLGLVTHWYLLGPFAAPGTSGFDLKLPPEEVVDLNATYTGMDDRPVKWTAHATGDPLGQVNLKDAIAAVREAVGFAYTEVNSPREQLVQLRCSADDNLTVWLNGEKVLGQRQWLNGTRLDRFITPVMLQVGTNRVLVKICQGPQHVNPEVPNNWSFQLRFCDDTGASVDCRDALPDRADE